MPVARKAKGSFLFFGPRLGARYFLKPTTRWARWDSGSTSPSHFSVTRYIPAFEIVSGDTIASTSFLELKLVGSSSPFNRTL